MLTGVRLIEVAALGPAPFCGMLLADLGADVILVDRREADPGYIDFSETSINRGKRSIALNLKSPEDIEIFMKLVASADALIEGFRPGVMERLGIGPEVCLRRNPRLVYGRATGWGQVGPWSHVAGHDHNYLALSGGLWYGGMPGTPPYTPPTVNGDAAVALYLALGLVTGILKARHTGMGSVVDAAIFDASAHMLSLILALRELNAFKTERGKSQFDGSHWSRTYQCACGGFISVQCTEPKFYRVFLDLLGLADQPLFAEQNAQSLWPEQTRYLERLFLTRTRDQWCEVFRDSDACFAPVLSPDEAAAHPHNKFRGAYVYVDGVLQAAPAPRFSSGPQWHPKRSPRRGEHQQEILLSLAEGYKKVSPVDTRSVT
jgi:acetyl-CoA hydrolase